jgi:uncharacterized membrane protein YagU involved in acid resistance
MDVVQYALAQTFERHRAKGDRDEEVEAIEGVVRILGRYVPALFAGTRAPGAARAVHYVFGVGFAAAYVAGVRRAPWLATSGGVPFGAALFVLSDRILIPVTRLGRTWSHYSRAERFNAFASHVTYGVVLETVRARFVERDRDARG